MRVMVYSGLIQVDWCFARLAGLIEVRMVDGSVDPWQSLRQLLVHIALYCIGSPMNVKP